MAKNSVSLKEHFEALRAADHRFADARAEWTKEKFSLHNDLLNKWRDATEKDRDNFVSRAAFEALKDAFSIYKEVTAKSLTLAEGKSKGIETVRTAVSFAAGLVVAGLTVWAATRGLR